MIRASVLLLLVLGIVAQASAYRFRYLRPGGPPPRFSTLAPMPRPMDPDGFFPPGGLVPIPRGGVFVAVDSPSTDDIREIPGYPYWPTTRRSSNPIVVIAKR
ncbi:hypothetical protein MTO96_019683 [Rhipicephalus appendiculatus]